MFHVTICPQCKERHRLPPKSYCDECFREYQRIWNKKNRKPYSSMSEIAQKKDNCRSYTGVLVKRGILQMGTECEWCGSQEELQRHHPDYSKPKEFQTICSPCHSFYHRMAKCA